MTGELDGLSSTSSTLEQQTGEAQLHVERAAEGAEEHMAQVPCSSVLHLCAASVCCI